ncbi:MAG TPA: acyl-CoA dehydrogenase family protein [Gemmatimonadaceae bacterium]|nr:acyl-CoA dehydrogenase family protein [Gemmatimonadaceae bacterium]
MTAIQTPAAATAAIPDTTDADALIAKARALGPLLREHAAAGEKERRVPKPVLDALNAAGFQRLLAPRSLGGLEVDPVTCARVVEEIARFDSAAAWALQSGNVNSWWAARLPQEGVDEIYGSDPSAMVAAAFHPPQHAIEVEGGYRVTGRGPLASMIHDCDWVLFSAFIFENGQPRMTEFGPEMIAVIMRTSEVEIIDTWHTLGMRGTDSNDAAFKDVFVPSRRVFALTPQFEAGKHFQGPLYRFPAVPIISLFSAGVVMAAGRNAIDEFRDLAQKKVPMGSMKALRDRGSVQTMLADAEATLRSARAFFYQTFSDAWERAVAGAENTLEHRADLLLAGIHAVRAGAQATDIIHRLAGTTGIYARSPFERYFRDAHTLRHHAFAAESKLESVGQIYLGLPPDFPLLLF